jgi:hypothetical protein
LTVANGRIERDHPLAGYHRDPLDRGGRSDGELLRQWGSLDIASELPEPGFAAGSFQTVRLRFRVGSLGLDEDGGFKLSFRFVSDMGTLQTHDPAADHHASATTTGAADIELSSERKGSRRPFQRTLRVNVRNASLAAGDEVTLVLGDRRGGGRGWRQQTYVEHPFPIRVAVDPLGTHRYAELPYDLGWPIHPGPAARFVLNAPSHGVAGVPFTLRLKAEDAWGNPLRELPEAPPIAVIESGGRRPLDLVGEHDRGVWSYRVAIERPGWATFETEGPLPSVSNGVVVAASEERLPRFPYRWCDLHGQTGETVGVGTIDAYFDFGRRYGFLDGSVHQGNDFQITAPLWQQIKRASHRAYVPDAFVTFPGYEWSGTSTMGGDHNVIYFEDDPPLYRSSGWLDGHPFEEAAPLERLYRALAPHDAITIAHVGGRPAALTESDPEIEPLMEIHSAWGTFEWVYREAFARGFKIGFVCGSDGHKGRPGASYPGAGVFGTLGGLTCVLASTFDREGFWEALRSRRCYGTSGQRIVVEADANGHPIGSELQAERLRIGVKVLGTAPIVSIELMRGAEVIDTRTPGAAGTEAPDTVLLRFGGALVRGRARKVSWEGELSLTGNALEGAEMHGLYSPIHGVTSHDEAGLAFRCVTTGNLVNLALTPRDGLLGGLALRSSVADVDLDLAALGPTPTTLFEAPLDRRIEALALRRDSLPLEAEAEFSLAIDHDEALPYFLRITQLDEGRAWTSPFYVSAGAFTDSEARTTRRSP